MSFLSQFLKAKFGIPEVDLRKKGGPVAGQLETLEMEAARKVARGLDASGRARLKLALAEVEMEEAQKAEESATRRHPGSGPGGAL